jgi:hypothetical protein
MTIPGDPSILGLKINGNVLEYANRKTGLTEYSVE